MKDVQEKNNQAADFALAILQIGAILQRGGSFVHVMNAMNFESKARDVLAGLRRELSPATADRVQAVLAKVAADRETREIRIARATAGRDRLPWQDRLGELVEEMRGKGWSFGLLVDEGEASHRLLQADLAIRSFFRDHGEFPAELRDLVPEYLPQELIDPHSGHRFKYRPGAPEFTLYSVGWDGRDDGGKFASQNSYLNSRFKKEPGLDFDLDTYTRQ